MTNCGLGYSLDQADSRARKAEMGQDMGLPNREFCLRSAHGEEMAVECRNLESCGNSNGRRERGVRANGSFAESGSVAVQPEIPGSAPAHGYERNHRDVVGEWSEFVAGDSADHRQGSRGEFHSRGGGKSGWVQDAESGDEFS